MSEAVDTYDQHPSESAPLTLDEARTLGDNEKKMPMMLSYLKTETGAKLAHH